MDIKENKLDYDNQKEMNLYTTSIKAICPKDGKLKTYRGMYVPGISFADAQNYCDNNELGFCKVDGLLVAEIPCKEGTYEPDWGKTIDYETIRLN